MKRYIYGITALLMAMLVAPVLTGCADDVEPFMTEDSGTDCIKLVVSVPMDAAPADDGSRAADPNHPTGDELNNNEFTVTKLHFYFYQGTNPGAETKSVYDCVWNEEEFDTQKTVTVSLPSNALLPGGIFPGNTDTECIVYAVANVDNENTLPVGTAKTINELKATALSSAFDETKVQESFAMDGQATVTVDRSTRIATGEITLQRAAAKITLAIDVPAIKVTNAEGNEVEYTPNTGAMHVWISNGVKNSMLNTAAAPVTEVKDLYTNTMEAKEGDGSAFTYTEAMEKYKYVQNMPFYSYPNKWESDKPEGNCYLTLVVPWTFVENGGTQPITTYYRIPVNPALCTIERNTHYDIRVTIGRLGSTEPQKPIDMEVDWNYAIPWEKQSLETDIKEVRYLLLNQNYYDSSIKNPDGTYGAYSFEMNNTTDIEIPIGTSHETIIASVKLSWTDYRINPPTKREIELTPTDGRTYKYSNLSSYNKLSDYAGIEMDNATSRLYLKRDLLHIRSGVWVEGYTDNNGTLWTTEDDKWVEGHWEDGGFTITENAALNTYTFDIVLQHKTDENRKAKVRIIQYPGIYIEAQKSEENTRFVNKNYSEDHIEQKASATKPPIYGYVNIDGDSRENPDKVHKDSRPDNSGVLDDDYNWDYYLGCLEPYYLNSTINNPFSYIVNISRLSNIDREYIVADPRERSVNNFPMNRDTRVTVKRNNDDPASWSVSDGNKVLSYYYPTSEEPSKSRYIAPAYRVASQWGMTQSTTYEGGKRRCASYQENGRPAGRWRLPTDAEIEYIARLSNEGYIPYLFGSSTTKPTYISGSGFITVDNTVPEVKVPENIQDIKEGFVRCVYDEWYWGNDTLTVKNQFRWGDRERSISGN